MDGLPSSASTSANSHQDSYATALNPSRKRARSSASSVGSSSKRAMSEDPSLASPGTAQSVPSSLTHEDADDIDSYMSMQGEDAIERSHSSAFTNGDVTQTSQKLLLTSPLAKYDLIRKLKKEPMQVGDTWYLVSQPWFRRWEKACTGEVDKEGAILESQLGPVDNSSFFDKEGKFDYTASLIEGVDVEFVPEVAWMHFVRWYGQTPYAIARQVIERGIAKQTSLELRPPSFQVFQVDQGLRRKQEPAKYITISTQATLDQLISDLLVCFGINASLEYRVWRLDRLEEAGPYLHSEKLKKHGAQLVYTRQDSDKLTKTVDELSFENDDSFALEVRYNVDWLVDAAEVQPSVSTPDDDLGPLFTSGTDFFSRMNSSRPGETAGLSSSSTLGPAASIPSSVTGKAKVDNKSSVPGTMGLVNMGNTCFMNSALQCLAHTKELIEYFLSGVFQEELNPDNPLGMQGAIAEAFGALLNRIWSTSGSSSYAPREFKMQLQRFAPQFSGYQQHDSQELVAFLLDGLHEDLNRVFKKPYVEKPDWNGGGDKELVELARISWEGYMKRNDSVIVDLFQGQYMSTLVCPECKKISITFDPFMYLTLPLPIQKKWTHKIYYVPWDSSKPHVRVPIEINRNASFREVRQLLGRWMNSDPDKLLTLETFSNRFYKDLDDTVLVGDMSDADVIVCFELPCHSQQSRTWKPDPDPTKNPLILPVHLCKELPSSRSTFQRSANGFAHPFVVVLDNQQVRDRNKIYSAIIERLERWTENARDLYSWEAEPAIEEVKIGNLRRATPVTEIKENGDIVTIHEEDDLEEVDIVDDKSLILDEGSEIVTAGEISRRIGHKQDLFAIHIQSGHERFGTTASWNSSGQKWESWETRASSDEVEDPPLVREGDALHCEWDANFRQYFFGDEPRLEHARWQAPHWQEFIHPEYKEAQQATLAREKRGISLRDCLEEFTKEEQLGEDDLWYCPQCKKHQQATKKFDIWTVPDILVVHLKRFSNSRVLRDKIDVFVDFPTVGLDLDEFCGERKVAKRLGEQGQDVSVLGLSEVDDPVIYDLYAVDEHLGGLGGGHYRAYAKNHENDSWYHFDDSYVSKARAEDAVNANAYLLFYKRRTNRHIGGKSHEKVEAALQGISIEKHIQMQLPTPPDDDIYISPNARQLGINNLDEAFSKLRSKSTTRSPSVERWSALGPAALSPAASVADDSELPSFDEAQFDEVVVEQPDSLSLVRDSYDFPDPSSTSSPSSSNEAEPDLDFPEPLSSDDWNPDHRFPGEVMAYSGVRVNRSASHDYNVGHAWGQDRRIRADRGHQWEGTSGGEPDPIQEIPVEHSTLLDIDL